MTGPGRQLLRWIWLAIFVFATAWYFQAPRSTSDVDLLLFDDEAIAHPFHSRITSPQLAKRIPAGGLSFGEWAARGRRLMQYMEGGSLQPLYQRMLTDGVLTAAQIAQCTSQSVFTNYNDLRLNGWERNSPGEWHPDMTNLDGDVYVLDVFRSLGISTSLRKTDNPTGDNEAVSWEQNQVVFNGRQVADATDAVYKVIYNTRNGVITGMFRSSPTGRRNEEYGDAWRHDSEFAIPDLQRSSDVVSLEWGELCRRNGHRPQGLRYYFSDQITNDDTLEILNIVLQRKGYDSRNVDEKGDIFARPWAEAAILDRDSEADRLSFEALVGSPVGRAIAWMLIQHAHLFGAKRIAKIRIWRTYSGGHSKNILWEIEDVR